MGKISSNIELCGKKVNSVEFADNLTSLSSEVFARLNGTKPYNSKEAFINSMIENANDLILYRDADNDFMAYTKFGSVYCCFNDDYYVVFYPKPSLIPTKFIEGYICQCLDGKDYEYVAELSRFLSLTDEEKDKQGFAFYSWLWEDGKWDKMAKYYHFDLKSTYNQKKTANIKSQQALSKEVADSLTELRQKMIDFE